ncbi:hypothetical protein [uncultured Mediterranean phage uvMED]|nr:hypothetical protein [uncultured Mediterranean phage uvMED]
MAGSLIKIDEFTISSAVASVILGGGSSGSSGLNASIDSTYDVYMVKINNWKPTTDNVLNYARVTVSGTPDTTANYDKAYKGLRSDTTFDNVGFANDTAVHFDRSGNAGGENTNGILYLFNFNNASEYSFMTAEFSGSSPFNLIYGAQGGVVHTVAQACDGIQFYFSSGNIDTGSKFVLYGLKK